jgi:hypothetical protein
VLIISCSREDLTLFETPLLNHVLVSVHRKLICAQFFHIFDYWVTFVLPIFWTTYETVSEQFLKQFLQQLPEQSRDNLQNTSEAINKAVSEHPIKQFLRQLMKHFVDNL